MNLDQMIVEAAPAPRVMNEFEERLLDAFLQSEL